MRSLNAFLKQNAIPAKNKTVPISDRFLDESGKPMLWEIRPIPEKENGKIRDSCMKRDYSKAARKAGTTVDFDTALYTQRLLAASVVYPDLKDAQLQASYGVVGEEELLVEMLYSDEYARLREEVDDFTGYISREQDEDKDEVKNF
jgi:hypothetical protein